jgi:hypothetical protein
LEAHCGNFFNTEVTFSLLLGSCFPEGLRHHVEGGWDFRGRHHSRANFPGIWKPSPSHFPADTCLQHIWGKGQPSCKPARGIHDTSSVKITWLRSSDRLRCYSVQVQEKLPHRKPPFWGIVTSTPGNIFQGEKFQVNFE